MNFTVLCVVFAAVLGVTLAYYDGKYVPKSFYIIDHFGHKSEPVYIRSKREVMNNYLRVKRSDSHSSAHSSASSSSSAGAGGGGGAGGNNAHTQGGGGYSPGAAGYNPSFVNPDDFFRQLQDMFNFIGSQAGHGQAFASSFSSASGGNGPSQGSGQGGLGSGHDAGYQGSGNIPTLFSRFGEAQGDGIQVSGSAQGEKGAFSSSSSSIDSNGNIKYSVKSGKL